MSAEAVQVGAARPHDRRYWALLASAALTTLALARLLVPDPRGLGTHTQLGLPPCAFFVLTGLPCPACGLTTCFAHMARGQLAAAIKANVFGVLLFAIVLAVPPLAVWAAARKRAFFETFARMHLGSVCIGLAVAALVAWFVRLGFILLR
jgi:hypothetical protein